MILRHRKLWVRVAGALPALVLLVMILFIYYVFIVEVVASLLGARKQVDGVPFAISGANSAVLLLMAVLLHVFYVPLLLSFYRVVLTDPGSVPSEYVNQHIGLILAHRERQIADPQQYRDEVTIELVDMGESAGQDAPALFQPHTVPSRGPVVMVHHIPRDLLLQPGPHDPRFCSKCRSVKPPRTHHCSICERCVEKMDHHCPWTANCIGFGNYKFFYLVLFHGCASTLVASLTWIPIALGRWEVLQPTDNPGSEESAGTVAYRTQLANRPWTFTDTQPHVIFAFVLCSSMVISVGSFLGMHTWLMLKGRTTLEGDATAYDHGWRKNWRLVMGANPRTWFWPVMTHDVLETTRGGTDFRRYVGDSTPWPASVYPADAARVQAVLGEGDADAVAGLSGESGQGGQRDGGGRTERSGGSNTQPRRGPGGGRGKGQDGVNMLTDRRPSEVALSLGLKPGQALPPAFRSVRPSLAPLGGALRRGAEGEEEEEERGAARAIAAGRVQSALAAIGHPAKTSWTMEEVTDEGGEEGEQALEEDKVGLLAGTHGRVTDSIQATRRTGEGMARSPHTRHVLTPTSMRRTH